MASGPGPAGIGAARAHYINTSRGLLSATPATIDPSDVSMQVPGPAGSTRISHRPVRRLRSVLGRWRALAFIGTLSAPLLSGCGGDDAAAAPEIPIGTEVGQRAPTLTGQSSSGEAFALESLAGGNSVLVFYTSGECGLCRLQLDQLEENISAYQRIDADVIAVTLDPADRSVAILERTQLTFPIVSVDSATFETWGVMDPDHATALPGTYVLDDAGVIRFRHIGRNVSDRTTDAEIVAVLESITAS